MSRPFVVFPADLDDFMGGRSEAELYLAAFLALPWSDQITGDTQLDGQVGNEYELYWKEQFRRIQYFKWKSPSPEQRRIFSRVAYSLLSATVFWEGRPIFSANDSGHGCAYELPLKEADRIVSAWINDPQISGRLPMSWADVMKIDHR